MILKICGITNREDAAAAVAGGATAVGFNFYPRSPRYIAPELAAEIVTASGVRRVGVFVNEDPARVEEIARVAALDVAQLHGNEAPADYPATVAVWKAARVSEGFDFGLYDDCPAEALLLDGPAGELYGGAGRAFDWKRAVASSWQDRSLTVAAQTRIAEPPPAGIAWRLAGVTTRRVILAGGLDASNVSEAIALVRPWGVDACSRIESAPGKKDHKKMTEFLQAAERALRS